MSGTVLAQVISILMLPILQKYVYSPDDFANFIWFFEYVTLFVSIGSLRLETGIILEKDDRQAQLLTEIAIQLMIVVSIIGLIASIIGSFFNPNFHSALPNPMFYALIPLTILALGIIQIFNAWFTRSQEFKFLAGNKVFQTSGTSLSQLSLGFTKFMNVGLIAGRLVGLSIVSSLLLRRYLKSKKEKIKANRSEKVGLIKKNKDFILFTTPSTFVGSFINFIFIDLFIRFFGETLSGDVATSKYYLGMALSIISSSFAQVFYSNIAQLTEVSEMRKYYTYWLKRLAGVSILILIVVLLLPNSFIIYLIGEKWSQLLPTLKIMSLWMCIMFVSSSLSYIYIKLNRQREMIFFDIAHLIITVLSITISYHLYHDFWITLYWFVAGKSVFYLSAIFASYYFFNHPKMEKNL